MKIGYARVSTKDQSTDLQAQQLKELGCEEIFKENASGGDSDRSQLRAMIKFARKGDLIVTMKTDRLARNTRDAIDIADQLKDKGVGLKLMDLGDVDVNSEVGRVIYTTISAFAQMEKDRILRRCEEGRQKAKQDGKHLGRFKNEDLHSQIKKMSKSGIAKAKIARDLGCSRQTVYRALKKN